jgi:hypothetical protein
LATLPRDRLGEVAEQGGGMSARDHNLGFALRLAAAGLHVFPTGANKRPLIRDWDEQSSTDPDQIRRWWRIRQGALVAIDLRKCGLVVIDADRHGGPDGVAAWHELVDEYEADLSANATVRTPSDGLHIYFRQPKGEPLRCRSGKLPRGIDVKGQGGAVTAPYCVRPDGTFYELSDKNPDLIEAFTSGRIPRVPDWLAQIIRWRPPPPAIMPPRFNSGGNGRFSSYAKAALTGQIADLSTAPKGGRNNALNAAAYRLGRMAARGWLNSDDIRTGLRLAARNNGLLAEDGLALVDATIASGLAAGLMAPAEDPAGRRR